MPLTGPALTRVVSWLRLPGGPVGHRGLRGAVRAAFPGSFVTINSVRLAETST